MNVIFVQAGQCGNQLGFAIYEALYKQLWTQGYRGVYNTELEAFFRPKNEDANARLSFFGEAYTEISDPDGQIPKLRARSVCVDTEPKVVNDVFQRSAAQEGWEYSTSNVLYRHGGAGNNWALGYQMCSGKLLESAIDAIRREVDACESPPLIIILHSTAGGTGSGLGTRLSEAVREAFPTITRVNICVSPYSTGEVAVQHYNSLLCLAKISSASDAVLLFENDKAHQLCKAVWQIASPSLSDINKMIATQMVPFLLPKNAYPAQQGSRPRCLVDDISHLCKHPSYKFLDIRCVPQTMRTAIDFTYDKWEILGGSLYKLLESGQACEPMLSSSRSAGTHKVDGETFPKESGVGLQAIGTSLTFRGMDASEASFAIEGTAREMSINLHRNSHLSGESVVTSFSTHAIGGYQRSASALTNGQACIPILQRATYGAEETYRVGAYLHQYESYGLERLEIVACFRRLGQAILDYEALSPSS